MKYKKIEEIAKPNHATFNNERIKKIEEIAKPNYATHNQAKLNTADYKWDKLLSLSDIIDDLNIIKNENKE